MIRIFLLTICSIFFTGRLSAQNKDQAARCWVTTGDGKMLLQKTAIHPISNRAAIDEIVLDEHTAYQQIEGFGFTLTGGSAYVLHRLPQAQRSALLNELFGRGPEAVGISYLRVSIGASDLDDSVFSYDDRPTDETDTALEHFSLYRDNLHLIPLLQEILKINPHLKIMGSPWSPPVWMKDNRSSKGGSLLPAYYPAYAQYFVRYVKAMGSKGIRIDAITPQNEPLHPGNNPSMYMPAEQQRDFIRDHLGPAFRAAAIDTKIIVYDHNCNKPEYPLTVLNDPLAKQYVAGSAFHLYEGDISALSKVHEAHPDKGLYFTEQWTGAKGDFDGDLYWHVKNVIIGATQNWSRIALEWNLASDPNYEPHTPGGCTECRGALTIDGSRVIRNVSYYIIAHAAKCVPPGSLRIASRGPKDLPQAGFLTPEGRRVLILLNEGNTIRRIRVRAGQSSMQIEMPPGSVVTAEL